MKDILYLCNRATFETKMSRVRFHGIKALEKEANLKWSGIGWSNYDNAKTVQENIEIIYPHKLPDIVIAYKPLEMKEFSKIIPLKCMRYNEMYDINLTFNEIMQCKPNIVICHHHNDYLEYKKRFENFSFISYLNLSTFLIRAKKLFLEITTFPKNMI